MSKRTQNQSSKNNGLNSQDRFCTAKGKFGDTSSRVMCVNKISGPVIPYSSRNEVTHSKARSRAALRMTLGSEEVKLETAVTSTQKKTFLYKQRGKGSLNMKRYSSRAGEIAQINQEFSFTECLGTQTPQRLRGMANSRAAKEINERSYM